MCVTLSSSQGQGIERRRTLVIFVVNIRSDSAAVDEDPRGEVATALGQIAETVLAGFDVGAVRDSSGNLIGSWSIAVPR
jgi:hypothetical protein